jgi:hypothetical protein
MTVDDAGRAVQQKGTTLSAGPGDELDPTVRLVADTLRSAPAPDLAHRVMAQLKGMHPSPSRLTELRNLVSGSLDWLWTPRPLRVRPAYALAVVYALLVLPVLKPAVRAPAGPGAGGLVGEDYPAAQVYVQFRLDAPGASRVAVAGNFTGWRPEYEMRETQPGVWAILVPLLPGVYDYSFVVNGSDWVPDPHAFQVADGFGGMNSRLALPSPPLPGLRL